MTLVRSGLEFGSWLRFRFKCELSSAPALRHEYGLSDGREGIGPLFGLLGEGWTGRGALASRTRMRSRAMRMRSRAIRMRSRAMRMRSRAMRMRSRANRAPRWIRVEMGARPRDGS